MKKISFIQLLPKVFSAVILLILVSCTRASIFSDTPDLRTAVSFLPKIGNEKTRANGNEWGQGDAIGIFMLQKGKELQGEYILDEADNRHYITASSGESVTLQPIGEDHLMYYPIDGASVDFIAYHPYRISSQLNEYNYSVRVDDQSDFSSIDLLYSTGSGSKHSRVVALNFVHQLSKIRIVVRKGAEMSQFDLSDAEVIISGMPVSANFALSNSTFNYVGTSGVAEIGDINMQAVVGGITYEAIVLPQSARMFKDRKIAFSLPKNNGAILPYAYDWVIPDGTEYRSGKEYTYNFTLRASGVDFGGVTITDWDDMSMEATAVEMASIAGGTFDMGSSDGTGLGLNSNISEPERNSDEVLHEVKLSNFQISRYPITNAQYVAFLNAIQMPSNGVWEGKQLIALPHQELICTQTSDVGVKYIWRVDPLKQDYPVNAVSWYGAEAFAIWYGGSLPTEAQWEYACRATTQTAYSFGDGKDRLKRYAWYEENNNMQEGNSIGIKEIGQKYQNSFTLHDMHGNVYEWCADWYANYATSVQNDPLVGDETSGKKVLRGGAYDSSAAACRSAARHSSAPEEMEPRFGFRIVFQK